MKNNELEERLPGSFRDPAGYVFRRCGRLFRKILPTGQKDMELLQKSGLADHLNENQLWVPYEISGDRDNNLEMSLYEIEFLTYPYEWSFSQLKAAGVLTLDLMLKALDCNMILKDASSFNIAFDQGKAIFLDHTSFTEYIPGEPWRAYKQFVMCFLAPLELMRSCDLRLSGLLSRYLDGIPLDLASRLLPWYSYLSLNKLIHIHLHGRMDQRYSGRPDCGIAGKKMYIPKKRLITLLETLKDHIEKLDFPHQSTQWQKYYDCNSYSSASFEAKKSIVDGFCSKLTGKTIVDAGANEGVFSEIAARYAKLVIAGDSDHCAVEKLYQINRETTRNLQPVLLDFDNPSPALGVNNLSYRSFFDRCRADGVMALALIHHLRISSNWSLEQIAACFAQIAPAALIEFVPADDVQVRHLMRNRESIYQDWQIDRVLAAFKKHFSYCRTFALADSGRILLELHKN